MLNFPDNPTTDQEWTDPNSMLWKFNGEMWRRQTTGKTLPNGGLTNQVLAKQSDTDYDAVWANIQADAGLF